MAPSETPSADSRSRYELLTLPLPYVLWFYAFGPFPPDFWFKLSAAGGVLLAVALTRGRRIPLKFSVSGLIIGLASGVLLYLFFWAGYHVMAAVPGFIGTVTSVYAYAGSTPRAAIALLLLFPIGPAEEFYWRGFMQGYLRGLTTPAMSIVLTSLIYASIHVVTLNPSLLLVALIGGIVWGYMYDRYGNLFPVLVSHILFDELIFVFLVIG